MKPSIIHQSHDVSNLVREFQSKKFSENRKIKRISSDISKLYRKINRMASDAKDKYDLDLDPLDHKSSFSNPKSFQRISLLEGFSYSLLQSPVPHFSSKNRKNYPEITIKFRDNKIPTNLMKKLSKQTQNDSISISINNSKLLLPDISCDKFGLKNKNLPSIYN
jgi:hypothetical protein